MKTAKDLRVRRTYKLLSDALLSLLKDYPFDQIRVTDICDKAMVHRTTFYDHFEDKYELLKITITDLQTNLKERLTKEELKDDLADYYLEITKDLIWHLTTYKDVYNSVLLNSSNPIVVNILHQTLKEETLTKLHAQENPDLVNTIPVDLISEFYSGAIFYATTWWLRKDHDLNELDFLNCLRFLVY